MNVTHRTGICLLVLACVGCAHQPVSLAQINQARTQVEISQGPRFQWHWQDQPQAVLAEVALQDWLKRHPASEYAICICIADNADSVEQMLTGWSQLKLLQQRNPVLQQSQNISVAHDPVGPVLRIIVAK